VWLICLANRMTFIVSSSSPPLKRTMCNCVLDPAVQFILSNMQQQPKLAIVSTEALSSICHHNSAQMTNHFEALMIALVALDALVIYEKGLHYLLEGIGVCLCASWRL
jgi:hypothetical protein